MNKIIECVPNFSEGRDENIIKQIVNVFENKKNIKLINYSSDKNHNRMVVTIIGEHKEIKECIIDAIGKAVELIDLTKHIGEHPRIGAVDVVPFIPIKNTSMEEAIDISKEVSRIVSERYNLPVYLYEKSATSKNRENLANIRSGQFEGLKDKMLQKDWYPDFGKNTPHPTAGAVAIGARNPLIAYNINLSTDDMTIAKTIAKKIRYKDGGFEGIKAMAIKLHDKNQVQVSINLTDYTQTSIYKVFEAVKKESISHGTYITNSELIGLMPLNAVLESFADYLKLNNFTLERIIESHII